MSRAEEVRARARALREEKAALQARLAAGEDLALRLELARVEEDLVDCARLLRELLPNHRIGRGTTWAGVDGRRWDRLQYQSWAELEGAEEPEGPTERDRMVQALAGARGGLTPAQRDYLERTADRRPAQAAREAGVNRSTVCRTLQRGKRRLADDARALYELLGRREGERLVVDLAEPAVLAAVLDRLTPRQQTYLYLYYGEWLSLREIGRLLGVDHASVLRSIRCALRRLEVLALGEAVEVRGLDSLEERLVAHFNDLPPEEPARTRGPYRKRGRPARSPAPVVLRDRLLRFVRGDQVRAAAGDRREVRTEGWGSGKLLAWLEGRRGEGGGGLLRRLLYRLFAWIRRDLDVDHH